MATASCRRKMGREMNVYIAMVFAVSVLTAEVLSAVFCLYGRVRQTHVSRKHRRAPLFL